MRATRRRVLASPAHIAVLTLVAGAIEGPQKMGHRLRSYPRRRSQGAWKSFDEAQGRRGDARARPLLTTVSHFTCCSCSSLLSGRDNRWLVSYFVGKFQASAANGLWPHGCPLQAIAHVRLPSRMYVQTTPSQAFRFVATCVGDVFSVFFLQLAVLSGLFRIHPFLRQRYCADWPEYQWAEICKRMRLEQVRSLDKVGARAQRRENKACSSPSKAHVPV